MNTLSSLLNFLGNTLGANPNTLATDSKTIVGAINELHGDIYSVYHANATVTNGVVQITYPSGYTSSDRLIVQPVYNASSIIGWSATVQLQPTIVNIYVRQGTTTPANGSKVTFRAFFFKA